MGKDTRIWMLATVLLANIYGCSRVSTTPSSHPPRAQTEHLPAVDADGLPAKPESQAKRHEKQAGWVQEYREYAVTSGSVEASAAGAEVLKAGGTAADAAVAVMLALGAAAPSSSGLGGGGYALYYSASTQEVSSLDFRETAPQRFRRDAAQAHKITIKGALC